MKKYLFIILILILCLNACDDETISPQSLNPFETIDGHYIASNGDLLIIDDDQTTALSINALTDGHILEDENDRLLILTGPTDRYQHGILGDTIEASSVTIVQLEEEPFVVNTFSISDDWVIESIEPIWVDWDEDGEREILLTLSNSKEGAKLVLYDEAGNVLAESPSIGKGNRWRHALDVVTFEDGSRLLVDIQTPHIGGILGFYSWDKENKLLKTEANLSSYSTHDIGSRLMHMYEVLEDDTVLLILPDQSKTELVALTYDTGSIKEVWRLPLGGRLSSDIKLVNEQGKYFVEVMVDDDQMLLLNIPE